MHSVAQGVRRIIDRVMPQRGLRLHCLHAAKKQEQQQQIQIPQKQVQIPKKQIQLPKKQVQVQKKQFQLPLFQKKQQQQQVVVAPPPPATVSGTSGTAATVGVAVGGRR